MQKGTTLTMIDRVTGNKYVRNVTVTSDMPDGSLLVGLDGGYELEYSMVYLFNLETERGWRFARTVLGDRADGSGRPLATWDWKVEYTN